MSLYKASRLDKIPNIILKKSAHLIMSRLKHIYTVILNHGFYYKGWQEFTMCILQKPGKPRQDIPKAYQPIALLCTMAKVLMALVSKELMYLAG